MHQLPAHMMQRPGARPTQKQVKERKDKNAPKRNWTAYQFYVEEHRQGLRDTNPEAGFGQLSKIAAAQWRALSADSKRRYEIMAENDKMRYQEEMRHYVAPPGTRGFAGGAKKKRKKNKDAPKSPLSAYFIFSSHIRPTVVFQHPDLNLPGVTKEIAERWRNLSAEDKIPFEEKSRADKQRYQMEMAVYKSSMM